MGMANTSQLKNVLQGYVGQIDSPLISARAQIVLDQYIDAENAYSNITKSAASSYSDARGTVNKRVTDEARDNKNRLWTEFVDLCASGGVTIPSDSSISYWDMSGNGSA